MQIDFGQKFVDMNGGKALVHVFVAKLGYSRRMYARMYYTETLTNWLDGIERALRYFGGIPHTVVGGSAVTLVKKHNGETPEEKFTERYLFFCNYYGIKPVRTAVRKPGSKGKVEAAVKYVKNNAMVGKDLPDLESWNAWLEEWCRGSDNRILNSVFDGLKTPRERWELEKIKLRTNDKPPLETRHSDTRKVAEGGLIRIEDQFYRIPNEFIGKNVAVECDEKSIVVLDRQNIIAKLDKTTDVYMPEQQCPSNKTGQKKSEAETSRQKSGGNALKEKDTRESAERSLARSPSVYDEAVGYGKKKGEEDSGRC